MIEVFEDIPGYKEYVQAIDFDNMTFMELFILQKKYYGFMYLSPEYKKFRDDIISEMWKRQKQSK